MSSTTPRGARGNLEGRRCEGAEEGEDKSGKAAKRGRRGFKAAYRNKYLPPRSKVAERQSGAACGTKLQLGYHGKV